jgi:hypothetical protein
VATGTVNSVAAFVAAMERLQLAATPEGLESYGAEWLERAPLRALYSLPFTTHERLRN